MAAPRVVGMSAPRHVYSARIKNLSSSPVKMTVYYKASNNSEHQVYADLDANTGEHYADQILDQPPGQTFTTTKRVSKIQVEQPDGNTLKLEEPFEGVTGPVKDWQFHINDNRIQSVKTD